MTDSTDNQDKDASGNSSLFGFSMLILYICALVFVFAFASIAETLVFGGILAIVFLIYKALKKT